MEREARWLRIGTSPSKGGKSRRSPPAPTCPRSTTRRSSTCAVTRSCRASSACTGFGDQREIELLVEAGFSPVEAIRIATLNGAIFLGRQDRIGSIAVGKNADLVVMKGDPAARIADIENVEIVFKDGVGYDTKKLLDSVKGHYGEY